VQKPQQKQARKVLPKPLCPTAPRQRYARDVNLTTAHRPVSCASLYGLWRWLRKRCPACTESPVQRLGVDVPKFAQQTGRRRLPAHHVSKKYLIATRET